jgi:predicted nucleic acid-binding protein
MDKYLVDTTVIIDCLRNRKDRPSLLKKLCLEGNILGCCCINVAEVYAGMKDKEREKTEELIDSLEYFEITRDIAKVAGGYIQKFSKEGITLSTSDAIIAATAVANNLILITDNPKHFPIKELRIYEF